MEIHFSWRHGRKMPFLDEAEWQEIAPLLTDATRAIKDYRREHKCDLPTARANCKPVVIEKILEMTGVPVVSFEEVYYLRRSDYGRECEKCSHLLRTPRASFCANCGWVPEGAA